MGGKFERNWERKLGERCSRSVSGQGRAYLYLVLNPFLLLCEPNSPPIKRTTHQSTDSEI